MDLLGVALAPSLFWLWYFWKQDRETREGAGPLARAFLLGALAVVPAAILELMYTHTGQATVAECFGIIGPAEEICKMLAAFALATWESDFDEPADGIVLSAAVALGFAFAENVGYFAGAGSGRVLIRSALSVPAHVLFAAPYGAALGRMRVDPRFPFAHVLGGLLLACGMHGLFDALLFHVDLNPPLFLGMFVGLVAVMWRIYRKLVQACAAEGRAIFAAQAVVWVEPGAPAPAASLPPVEVAAAVTPRERFQWISAASAFFYGLVFFLGVAAVWTNVVPKSEQQARNPELGSLCIVALVLGGLVSAYRSPGYTVRESAAGLATLGFLVGGGLGGGTTQVLSAAAFAVMLGGLGAFGGWLGEALQSMRGG